MAKKKLFGVSSSINEGIRSTISAVENNLNNFRFSIVSLDQIELDPENPRDLAITIEDVKNGLQQNDPHYATKTNELEALSSLSETIKLKGLINPIVLYKSRDKYRLIAGERRYLASVLADKDNVQARILDEKPHVFDVKLLQWIENNEREDLSLKDRLLNIKAILESHKSAKKIDATLLKTVTGMSLSQASFYVNVIQGPEDVFDAIMAGKIQSLDKAAFIAGIESDLLRQEAIMACANGFTLRDLKKFIQQRLSDQTVQSAKKRGAQIKKINLGSTQNKQAIKTLIMTVINLPEFKEHATNFKAIEWSNPNQITKAFKELLNIFENKSKS